MATITSSSMSFVLDEVVSAIAFESYFDETFTMPSLFSIRSSSKRRERAASLGGLGEWTVKNPTAAADEEAITEQFAKTYTHSAYAKQVPVERELIDDEEYGLLADLGMQLGTTAAYTMENHAASVFRNAFTTALADDGLSLCNSAHLNVDGGNSQSNSGTTAFSMAAVKSTRTAMRKFTNYGGELLAVRPDTLIMPPDLEEDAWEVIRSTGRPDTASRADNFYNGMFRLVVWDFISTGVSGGDANNWFMADSRGMSRNLLWYQRTPLETFGTGDLFTGTRKIGGYMRYSYGARDWRWVYGHAVT